MTQALSVAIVGGGPRALWAVEELLGLAWRRALSIDITVYDSGPLKAYDPSQPDYWLLNVNSAIVRTTTLGSFQAWAGNTDPYPPRAQVGEFLAESWARLPIPDGCSLTRVNQRVEDPSSLDADEVLVVTGHPATWDGALDGALSVYPHGSLDSVAAGATVAIRGTSLTFIDAVLDLTVGRGGCFDGTTYHASGNEPKTIYPYNRSGRYMEAKVDPDHAPDTTAIINEFSPAIAEAATTDDIAGIIARAAASLLPNETTGGPASAADSVSNAIHAVLDGTDFSGDAVAELRHSYLVATGQAPLSPAAAVGITFRALYPALIERISFNEPLAGFRDLARRLERVAFGPPSVNVGRILGLIDAGIIAPTMDKRDADHIIDAVLAPTPAEPVRTGRDGLIAPGLSYIGRDTEYWVLGNDTLSRDSHDVIPRWARRVAARISPTAAHGAPPLTARLEPWAEQLTADWTAAKDLIDRYDSPVNVLNTDPMLANVDELVSSGAAQGVDVKIFFARKANKALTFVDTVTEAGHGVDVASFRELKQVLDRGVPGHRIILSAAIKPDKLLRLAIDNGVTISVDTVAELERIVSLADHPVNVAPRMAPDPRVMPPTRFGERRAAWATALTTMDLGQVRVTGIHVHLHGYSARDRSEALIEVFTLIDSLHAHGHRLEFVDMGGGVPMSYIDNAQQWQRIQRMRNLAYGPSNTPTETLAEPNTTAAGHIAPFTWKSDPLRTVYPYHQSPTRGPWLTELLAYPVPGNGPATVAEALIHRGLRLHLEPGRSLLDGCGMTLARVAFVKTRSDGVPLVGLAMNRTQTRTTSDDYLIDPLHLPAPEPTETSTDTTPAAGHRDARLGKEEIEAYLVGAYCIEDELILRRPIRFPNGVKPGDIIAIPNAAGYFMHILESASHQIPLAHNVLWPSGEADDIDATVTFS